MSVFIALCAVLWTAVFPVQNEENSQGLSQAYVSRDLVLVAGLHSIDARGLRDGSLRWSRSGIGLPVDARDSGILAATPTGVAYLSANGVIRFRIHPCAEEKQPVAVALGAESGVALCEHTDGIENLMRAVFFSLASGRVVNVDETIMPSHPFPIFGWRFPNDRYGIRAWYSGARLVPVNDVLSLARRRVEDPSMGEDEAMQLAERAEESAKFCRKIGVPGRELRSGSFLVQTCGGVGSPLTVTVFGP